MLKVLRKDNQVAIGARLADIFQWRKIDVAEEAQKWGVIKVYDSEQGSVYKFPTDLLAESFYGSLNRQVAISREWEPRSGWAPSRGNPSQE
jgi:hypothetical protein